MMMTTGDFSTLARMRDTCTATSPPTTTTTTTTTAVCTHASVVTDMSTSVCIACGCEIEPGFNVDKEWSFFYGTEKNKTAVDMSRCYMRKTCTKTIFKDLEPLGFNSRIVYTANELYQRVTQGKIHRGNSRKSIVFAVCFHAFKLMGSPQTCENLIRIFGIKRKVGLKGLKHIHLNIDKDIQIPNIRITPEHIIADIMSRFIASDHSQVRDVIAIYHQVKDKSTMLNRSRPTSIAAGIIYHYICMTNKPITLKQFSQEVELSDLTIKKITREVAQILDGGGRN